MTREYTCTTEGLQTIVAAAYHNTKADNLTPDGLQLLAAIAERVEALVDAVDQQTQAIRPVEHTTTDEQTQVTLSRETMETLRNIQRGE